MRRPGPLLPLLLLVALGAPARADPETDEALEALASPRAAARASGAAALRRAERGIDRERALAALHRALGDAAPAVRRAVAASLERLADRRSAPALAARLDLEREPTVLAALLLALGATGGPGHAPRIVVYASCHPVPSVRAAAVTALGDLGGPIARRTALDLVRAPGLPDPDWSLRSAGVLALARCGRPEDVGEVLVAYREGGGRHHWFARAALARLAGALDPDPLPLLRRLVEDPDPRVAVTAATAIGRRGGVEALSGLLRHESPTVRAAAASAAGRLRHDATYETLRALARLDPARRVRWAAALALFRAEEAAGDELVLAGLRSREPVVWAEALGALTERTGESHGRDTEAWRAALRRWREAR